MIGSPCHTQPAGGEQPPEWFEPCLHSAYFQISAKHFTGEPRAITGQPRLLPLIDFLPLLDAIKAREMPEQGVEMGLAFPVAAHGLVGLAAASSATLWDAMLALARYSHVRNMMFDYHCFRLSEAAVIELRPRLQLGEFAKFFGYATVSALYSMFKTTAEESGTDALRFSFPWAQPACLPALAGAWPACDFDRPYLRISISSAMAMRPSQSAEPDVCERLKLALEDELTKSNGSTAAKVRHIIRRQLPEWPSLQLVAHSLGMSRRTLARKLEAEALSFQVLLDDTRCELACWYLRRPDMRIVEISERLGFSDQASFTRSFRRVQGLCPTQYRAHLDRAPAM